jgi:hypothetical protein
MLSQEYSDLEVRSQSSYEGKEVAYKGRNKPLPYPGLPQVLYDADNLPELHWIIGKCWRNMMLHMHQTLIQTQANRPTKLNSMGLHPMTSHHFSKEGK